MVRAHTLQFLCNLTIAFFVKFEQHNRANINYGETTEYYVNNVLDACWGHNNKQIIRYCLLAAAYLILSMYI
jgi:hypothetical protein